ncbi:MAG: FHA domain-containing protein, partial [Anaerolineae bacterium]|nr:FHA domain-containing protein [Anaerolineae bacterium]
MTYGRLDVYWPTGAIEVYQLRKDSVAIGRSPGNDIVLDATAVSRYHVSLTYRDDQVYLEDLESVNSTYVDGVKLTPNDPRPLSGGEEIQIGEIRLIYHPADESPTEPITDAQVTRRIEYEQPTYRVELAGPEQPVTPGVYVQALLVIQNLSEEQDRYFIEIDGVPQQWVRIERVEVLLEPEERTSLVISFKPQRKPDSTPGDYPFTVRVRSKSRPTQTVDASMSLRVLPYSGFGIDLGRKRVMSGEVLPIFIHNQGNAPLQLSFAGHSEGDALRFDFQPPTVVLGGGQRMTIRATLATRHPLWLGTPHSTDFVVMARSHDASGFLAPLPGEFTAQPVLHGWRLGAAVGGVMSVVLLIIAVLALLLTPNPPPEITSLSVEPEEIVAGEAITLNWTAQNADALRVEVDGLPLDAALEPGLTTLTFNILNPGGHEVALVASSGDRAARAAVAVLAHEVLRIDEFSATPATLVRYVAQDVLLAWNVPGGLRVRLAGLAALTGEDESTTYEATDSRLVRIEGRETIMVTLLAEGGAGQTAERVLTLPVEDPVCLVLADDTPIYAGPSL